MHNNYRATKSNNGKYILLVILKLMRINELSFPVLIPIRQTINQTRHMKRRMMYCNPRTTFMLNRKACIINKPIDDLRP